MKLLSPKTKPQDYGFKKGDFHLIVNALSKTARAYDSEGKLLWVVPALATGQDPRYWTRAGNTPPGVWHIGQIWKDKDNGEMTPPYGWYVFDLVDLEGREDGNNRAGLAIHGGGSSLPDPFAPYQGLVPTLGCVRMNNQDLIALYQLTQKGKVFVSVYQVEP